MPTCPKCAAQVPEGTKFCSSCGSSLEQTAGGSTTTPPTLSAPAGQPPANTGGIAPNVAALLVYIPFCFIGLICAILFGFILEPHKKDRFVRFHAWQSLAVHGAFLVLWVGWVIASFVLTAIARPLAMITVPISMLLGLGALILMVLLMIKAYSNQMFKLPVVGDWAEKQAGA